MKRRAFFTTVFLAGAVLLAGCSLPWSAEKPTPVSRLVNLMAARLEIARDVAWAKASSGAQVLDTDRERVLLAALMKQGEEAGLDKVRVEKFFNAQITASRKVQTELMAAWAAGTAEHPAKPPLDLRTQIRPRLDALSAELITALTRAPEVWSAGDRARVSRALRQRGFSEPVSMLAADGLR